MSEPIIAGEVLTGWTAAQLDALPEGFVLQYTESPTYTYVKTEYGSWWCTGSDDSDSSAYLASTYGPGELVPLGRTTGFLMPAPTVDQIADTISNAWEADQHGQLCPRWTRRNTEHPGSCTCWIRTGQAASLAVHVHALVARGEATP